jgi:hypothetical protein
MDASTSREWFPLTKRSGVKPLLALVHGIVSGSYFCSSLHLCCMITSRLSLLQPSFPPLCREKGRSKVWSLCQESSIFLECPLQTSAVSHERPLPKEQCGSQNKVCGSVPTVATPLSCLSFARVGYCSSLGEQTRNLVVVQVS